MVPRPLGDDLQKGRCFPKDGPYGPVATCALLENTAEWRPSTAMRQGMIYRFADCVLDEERRELLRAGHVVPLEPQVFDLLVLFARRPDSIVARSELIEAVWDG